MKTEEHDALSKHLGKTHGEFLIGPLSELQAIHDEYHALTALHPQPTESEER